MSESVHKNTRSNELLRFIDRYLGIPLVIILSLFMRKRRIPSGIKFIGLIQPTAIGDLILCSGLIKKISDVYPDAEIVLFHGRSNAAAIPLLGFKFIAIECNFQNPIETIKNINKMQVDVLIDLCPWSRVTALITRLSNAKYTVGFNASNQFRHFMFDRSAPHKVDRHEIKNLKEIDIWKPDVDYDPFYLIEKFDIPSFEIKHERVVIFHCFPGGSRKRFKSWPTQYWVELAHSLINSGCYVMVSGCMRDSDEADHIIREINRPSHCESLARLGLTLSEFAYILRKSKLLVTIDTGVLHLGAALNVPMISLHGPTSSKRWGPISKNSIAIDALHKNAGYIHFGFERNACEKVLMGFITPRIVYEQCLLLLRKL